METADPTGPMDSQNASAIEVTVLFYHQVISNVGKSDLLLGDSRHYSCKSLKFIWGKMISLTDKDRQVLRALLSNSDLPRKTIASNLGMKEPDFSRTVKKLLAQGVIKKFTVDVDFSKVGFRDGGILIFSVTDKKMLRQVVPRLLKYPEIIEVQEVFGADYDLVVRFMAEDNQRIRTICMEIEEWEETNSSVDQFTLIFGFTHRNERGVPI